MLRVFNAFFLGAFKRGVFLTFDSFLRRLSGILYLLGIFYKVMLIGIIGAGRRPVAFAFVLLAGILLTSILLAMFVRLTTLMLVFVLIAHCALLLCGRQARHPPWNRKTLSADRFRMLRHKNFKKM